MGTMNRFRAVYVAAAAVIGIGISGSVIMPRAEADFRNQSSSLIAPEPRLQAGKYIWKKTALRLRSDLTGILGRNPADARMSSFEGVQMAYIPQSFKRLENAADIVPFED